MARLPRKLLFSLVPVALLLASAELLARLHGPPPSHLADHLGGRPPSHILMDPDLGWRLVPGEYVADPDYEAWARKHGLPLPPPGEIRVNSLGLRDDELERPKPPGQQRVWCMGDSSVFGNGVPRDETFSQRLEATLNRARGQEPTALPRAVEVINAGTSGYSSFQALALLERNLDQQPDVVIVYLMNSDLMEFRGSPDSVWFKRWHRGVDLSLLHRSQALRWVAWWRSYSLPFRRAPDGLLLRVRVEDFRDNLRAIVALGRRHAFRPVFVVPAVQSDLTHPEDPGSYTPAGPEDLGRLRSLVSQAERADHWTGQTRQHFRAALMLEGATAGVPVVDGAQVLGRAWREEPARYQGATYLFVDQVHPSSEGHRLLAEALAPVVEAALGQAD